MQSSALAVWYKAKKALQRASSWARKRLKPRGGDFYRQSLSLPTKLPKQGLRENNPLCMCEKREVTCLPAGGGVGPGKYHYPPLLDPSEFSEADNIFMCTLTIYSPNNFCLFCCGLFHSYKTSSPTSSLYLCPLFSPLLTFCLACHFIKSSISHRLLNPYSCQSLCWGFTCISSFMSWPHCKTGI